MFRCDASISKDLPGLQLRQCAGAGSVEVARWLRREISGKKVNNTREVK